MANLFPCPNTQCAYQFDADQLPAAAMVTCPMCRTKFPYRARVTAPVEDNEFSSSMGSPGTTSTRTPGAGGGKVVRLHQAPKSKTWPFLIFAGCILAFIVAVAIVLITKKGKSLQGDVTIDAKAYNLQIEPFPANYEKDREVEIAFELTVFCRKNTSVNGYLLLHAQDFKTREPRASELEAEAKRKIRNYLTDTNIVPLNDPPQLAGKPSKGWEFDGIRNEENYKGEVLVISYKGIAYWYFLLSRSDYWSGASEELRKMRAKLKLSDTREFWKPEQASQLDHLAPNGDYLLTDDFAVWKRAKLLEEGVKPGKLDWNANPEDFGKECKMAFSATYQPRDKGDSRQQKVEVTAIVVELPKSDNPMDAAKKHLVERIKEDWGDDSEVSLKALDGGGKDSVARFSVPNPKDKDGAYYYVLGAINVGDKTVAVEIGVRERSMAAVDDWMLKFASSLRAK